MPKNRDELEAAQNRLVAIRRELGRLRVGQSKAPADLPYKERLVWVKGRMDELQAEEAQITRGTA